MPRLRARAILEAESVRRAPRRHASLPDFRRRACPRASPRAGTRCGSRRTESRRRDTGRRGADRLDEPDRDVGRLHDLRESLDQRRELQCSHGVRTARCSCSVQPPPSTARVTAGCLRQMRGREIAKFRNARDLDSQGGVRNGCHGLDRSVVTRSGRKAPAVGESSMARGDVDPRVIGIENGLRECSSFSVRW